MSEETWIGAATVVVRSSEPIAVEVDRSVVMMSLEREKYYGLEGPGGRIWQLIETPRTVAEVCSVLLEEFDVDPDACLTDVREFLSDLLREGLVRVVERKTTPVHSSRVS